MRLGAPVAGSLPGPGGAGGPGGAASASAGERAASPARVGGAPMRGMGAGSGPQDDEHDSPDYLRKFDRLEDGRTVVPAVIGEVAGPGPR